jgi:hypothetical protein
MLHPARDDVKIAGVEHRLAAVAVAENIRAAVDEEELVLVGARECQTKSPLPLASFTYRPLAMPTSRGDQYSAMASNSRSRWPIVSMRTPPSM